MTSLYYIQHSKTSFLQGRKLITLRDYKIRSIDYMLLQTIRITPAHKPWSIRNKRLILQSIKVSITFSHLLQLATNPKTKNKNMHWILLAKRYILQYVLKEENLFDLQFWNLISAKTSAFDVYTIYSVTLVIFLSFLKNIN